MIIGLYLIYCGNSPWTLIYDYISYFYLLLYHIIIYDVYIMSIHSIYILGGVSLSTSPAWTWSSSGQSLSNDLFVDWKWKNQFCFFLFYRWDQTQVWILSTSVSNWLGDSVMLWRFEWCDSGCDWCQLLDDVLNTFIATINRHAIDKPNRPKPNVSNQTYQAKCTPQNLRTRCSIPNQTYRTRATK